LGVRWKRRNRDQRQAYNHGERHLEETSVSRAPSQRLSRVAKKPQREDVPSESGNSAHERRHSGAPSQVRKPVEVGTAPSSIGSPPPGAPNSIVFANLGQYAFMTIFCDYKSSHRRGSRTVGKSPVLSW
jgi:hypothetical protein